MVLLMYLVRCMKVIYRPVCETPLVALAVARSVACSRLPYLRLAANTHASDHRPSVGRAGIRRFRRAQHDGPAHRLQLHDRRRQRRCGLSPDRPLDGGSALRQRCLHHPGGLRRDERLEPDSRQQVRFGDLRLQRRQGSPGHVFGPGL